MANRLNPLLRRSVGTLRRTTKSAAGVSITYFDKSTKTAYEDVVATLASTTAEQETLEGLVLTYNLVDFKVDVDDLPVTPAKYDTITWVVDGNRTMTFQVLPVSNSAAVDSYDNYRQAYVIHTKEIPSEQFEAIGYVNSEGHAYTNPNSEAYTRGGGRISGS